MKGLESRDRELQMDQDVRSVLEFMQSNISVHKLVAVASALPQIARLLWVAEPQEPLQVLSLVSDLPVPSTSCEKQPISI